MELDCTFITSTFHRAERQSRHEPALHQRRQGERRQCNQCCCRHQHAPLRRALADKIERCRDQRRTYAVTQSAQGFDATIGKETLRLVVCSDSILHVITRPNETTVNHPQPWLLPPDQSCKGAPFQFTQDEKLATLKTATLTASISLARGNLTFTTPDGKQLFHERDSVPRTYDPVTLNGDTTFHVVDRFWPLTSWIAAFAAAFASSRTSL